MQMEYVITCDNISLTLLPYILNMHDTRNEVKNIWIIKVTERIIENTYKCMYDSEVACLIG